MSMNVDMSTPLTAEERDYLESRGRYGDIEKADGLNGVTDAPDLGSGDGTGLQQVSLMTSEQRASEADRLRARLAEIEGTGDADDSDEDPEPYEVWASDDLKAEIDARNAERSADRKISKSGNKSDLAARLYQDDAEASLSS